MFEDKNKNAFTTASTRFVLDFPRLNSRFYPSPSNLNSKILTGSSNQKEMTMISPYDIEESSFSIIDIEKTETNHPSRVHFITTEKNEYKFAKDKKNENHAQIILKKDFLSIKGKKRSKTSTLLNKSLKCSINFNNHSTNKMIGTNPTTENK
ncbi:hypothetical protein M9Y10_009649 [Tritrichomonas musculus]|uniref:Uncharacterized protein n=1 Tax=Tritrichomonas musculus TaxID=1915356 RepID=A0ABR2IQ49_9EUKA